MRQACMDFVPVGEWGLFPAAKPWLIAGPCSAESEGQVLETARRLRELSGKDRAVPDIVFRAGLWKQRTHPGGYEGPGPGGLPWLLRARQECGLKICTEVACAAHVKACIAAGVDMVWIGARTTPSPYLMQEIADALEGSDLPVLVKNPIACDLELWSGAVERLLGRGVRKLGLVHRGVSSLSEKRYRNDPAWDFAQRMRSLYPDLPCFFDPSHVAGARDYVPELSRRALEESFDGLMVEVHPRPDEALSDAAQQLTPAALEGLLASL